MTGDRNRTIKLYCPSVSETIQFGPCDFEQKIDLGSIAGFFGVDANSLMLNGHFISRGADLIASSLTWNSLLSFFSARGFPTGLSASDPLIVHAKLASKRHCDSLLLHNQGLHSTENSEIGAMNTNGHGFDCLDRRLAAANSQVSNEKRLKVNDTREDNQATPNLKRRLLPEDQNPLKRTRTNGTNSVAFRGNFDLSNTNNAKGRSELSCSFISQNRKRAREDKMLLADPCKRLK